MAGKADWVPWYRRKDYKGNLSEEEKRALDSFRFEERHPATSYEDLPEDVQKYISRIELELYDKKQEIAAGKAFTLTGIAAFLIYLIYIDNAYYSPVAYVFSAAIVFFAWLNYRREWNKNANELFPKEDGAPSHIDEGIQSEWEQDYIVRLREQKDEDPTKDP